MRQFVQLEHFPLAPISFISDRVPESDKIALNDDCGLIVDISDFMSGHDMETKTLQKVISSLPRKSHVYEQMVYEYKSLHTACTRLTWYLTTLVPANDDESLLRKCLLNGIKEFDMARKESFYSDDASLKMTAFIYGCSTYFHEILLNNIYGRYEDAWTQWKPLSEPISEWIIRYNFKELMIVPTTNELSSEVLNAASNKLLFEIFDFSDITFCKISNANNTQVISSK